MYLGKHMLCSLVVCRPWRPRCQSLLGIRSRKEEVSHATLTPENALMIARRQTSFWEYSLLVSAAGCCLRSRCGWCGYTSRRRGGDWKAPYLFSSPSDGPLASSSISGACSSRLAGGVLTLAILSGRWLLRFGVQCHWRTCVYVRVVKEWSFINREATPRPGSNCMSSGRLCLGS